MRQTRLFQARVNRDLRIAYLKEAARAAAEGYWGHSLTELSWGSAEDKGSASALGAECKRCGAEVRVRPDAKHERPDPTGSSLPPIDGSAVSQVCDSDCDSNVD